MIWLKDSAYSTMRMEASMWVSGAKTSSMDSEESFGLRQGRSFKGSTMMLRREVWATMFGRMEAVT